MKRFSNILLVADRDTDHSAALKRAVTLANNNQARLTVCAIVDAISAELQVAITAITPVELRDIAANESRDWLEEIVKAIPEDGASIETKVFVGKPFLEIIQEVLKNNHDLVIKSAEAGTGLENRLFGSTDLQLLRKCPCPVWIIKPTEHHQYRRILAAVDQDPENAVKEVLNRQILEMSASLALAEFSELHVVHAWQLAFESNLRSPLTGGTDAEVDAMVTVQASARRRWLEDLVNTYGTKADKDAVDYLTPQLHLIKGDAKYIVPAMARDLDVDLIVMGTIARTGIAGVFIGNTAESILGQINCSVLTIKPSAFVSPITLEA